MPEMPAGPFASEVWVMIHPPSGHPIRLPAFYDGTDEENRGIWKFRFTPLEAGKHSYEIFEGPVALQQRAPVEGLETFEFDAGPPPAPGFVRIDPRHRTRFIFDNGQPYYPIGHNVAWGKGNRPDRILPIFDKMSAAGENWARVWMTHWDRKNLEWIMKKKQALGHFDLKVARTWDTIVESAEKNDLCIQITLQHHGQYSSRVNPNWHENPWNEKNGGFLKTADEFFTHPRARELTRQKYRYIVARWGHSPAVLAWELFNEVQYTDAYENKRSIEVQHWHEEMADYLRSIDTYRHLITTSALPHDHPVWRAMDYYQFHSYPADLIAAAGSLGTDTLRFNKPAFYGEMGPGGNLGPNTDDERHLKMILWASLLSESSGTAQYWAWDTVEKNDLYRIFAAVTRFATESKLLLRPARMPVSPVMECESRCALKFGPGGGWQKARHPEILVPSDGRPIPNLVELSPYLHGDPKKVTAGFPREATFLIRTGEPTTFTAEIGTIAKAGARAKLIVDGKEVQTDVWAPKDADYDAQTRLSTELSPGRHTVMLKSVGKDWFYVKSFAFSDFAPALAAVGTRTSDFGAFWVYHREGIDQPGEPAVGTLTLADWLPGNYRVVWWNTESGERILDQMIAAEGASLKFRTPPIVTDAAVFVERIQ